MSQKTQQLKTTNPELANDPQVLAVMQDIDRYAAVAALTTSEGGKELRKAMRSDIVAGINELIASYGRAELPQMLTIVAKIDARVSLLQGLGNAKQNKEDAELILDELTG